MNVTLPAFLIIQCETYGTTALDALYTELLQPPTKLGIIGSGCSLATEPTAQISHYYNITHVNSRVYIALGLILWIIIVRGWKGLWLVNWVHNMIISVQP